MEFWLWTSHSGTYDLLNSRGEWDSERGELIEDRDTHEELRDLTIKVSRREALTEQFDAVHFRLDAASAVIPAPASPDRPPEAF